MAELADALGSGSSGRKAVRVQIPPSAPRFIFTDFRDRLSVMLKWTMALVCSLLYCMPLYAFDSELWPGEGKPSFFTKTNILIIHKEPTTKSPIKNELKTGKGERIHYDMTRYRNIKPGIVKTNESVILTGKNLGSISYLPRSEYYYTKTPYKDYAFKKGDDFEYLQYRAEGSCVVRWKSEVYVIEYCPWLDIENKAFTVEADPVNEWWIRVIKNNAPLGWLLIEEHVVEVKRSF